MSSSGWKTILKNLEEQGFSIETNLIYSKTTIDQGPDNLSKTITRLKKAQLRMCREDVPYTNVDLVIYPNGRVSDIDITTVTPLTADELSYLRQQLVSAIDGTGYRIDPFRRIGKPLI